jgi:cobalt-zinc-cadmium efflux system outer membrane protein
MFTRLGRSLPVAAALLAFAASSSAGTEEPAISLRESLSRALQSNPDLAAYAFTLKAQDGRITNSVRTQSRHSGDFLTT